MNMVPRLDWAITVLRFVACCGLVLTSDARAVILSGAPANPMPRVDQVVAATVFFRSVGGNYCTGTVVGTRAIVTAANCVGSSAKVVAQLGEVSFTLQCSRLSDAPGPFVDLALCASETPLTRQVPVRVEVTAGLSAGELLLMAGYGCSSAGALDRAMVGRYTQGEARVTQLDVGRDREPLALVSGAAACLGDAGGGVYRVTAQGQALLVGSISRSDMVQNTQIVPLAASLPLDRMRQWSDATGVGICGLSADNHGCSPQGLMTPALTQSLPFILRVVGHNATEPAPRVEGQLVMASGADETAARAFDRVCGAPITSVPGIAPERVQEALAKRPDPTGLLQIPACPVAANPVVTSAAATTTQTVRRGDSVWGFYKSRRDLLPPSVAAAAKFTDFAAFVKKFSEANPTASTQLTPNTIVTVPPVVAAGTSTTVPAAIAVVSAPSATPILSLANDPSADCAGPSAGAAYPYDLALLLDVLAMNRQADEAPPIAPVAISIADSGVLGGGHGIFASQVLSKRASNDFRKFLSSVQPQVLSEPAHSHGTVVASVAMGGPMFARLTALSATPVIQLAIHRIYHTPAAQGQAVTEAGVADLTVFDELIRLAESKEASIVNLSLRSTVRIPAIEASLRDNSSRLLFVAAAGNQNHELSADLSDDKETMYPALYGGDAQTRVMTVMATDAKGKRAPFSNWSATFIDIAAPGCKVPALAWDKTLGRFVETAQTGTSLSAPLVAFAAALVRSESGGEFSPLQLKRRVLVSADLTPDLITQVSDGRRLNVPKAASLRNDVVEVNGRLLFGDVLFRQDGQLLRDSDFMSLECNGKRDQRIRRDALFKIARWVPEPDGPRWKVYFRSSQPQQIFLSDVCKLPPSLRLEFRRRGSDSAEALAWTNTQDLVMRHRDPE